MIINDNGLLTLIRNTKFELRVQKPELGDKYKLHIEAEHEGKKYEAECVFPGRYSRDGKFQNVFSSRNLHPILCNMYGYQIGGRSIRNRDLQKELDKIKKKVHKLTNEVNKEKDIETDFQTVTTRYNRDISKKLIIQICLQHAYTQQEIQEMLDQVYVKSIHA